MVLLRRHPCCPDRIPAAPASGAALSVNGPLLGRVITLFMNIWPFLYMSVPCMSTHFFHSLFFTQYLHITALNSSRTLFYCSFGSIYSHSYIYLYPCSVGESPLIHKSSTVWISSCCQVCNHFLMLPQTVWYRAGACLFHLKVHSALGSNIASRGYSKK